MTRGRIEALPALAALLSGGSLFIGAQRVWAVDCPITSTHTDADFTIGSYTAQAGFQQGEIAAASYVLAPDDYPFRIESIEMIFRTNNATVETTTRYSILVWQGTPPSGTLIATRSSNGTTHPHIVLGAGTNAYNARLTLPPGAPGQIIVNDEPGHTFSVGYRIDAHNSPPADPCRASPPSCCNAFPTTDTSGLNSLPGNWLFGINCGALSCPANGGWASFSQLPTYCRPSGDWVLRVRRCGLAPVDFDRDGDVDRDDFDTFVSCSSGPNVSHDGSPTCQAADVDDDNDVDLDDFGQRFQRCYSGPDTPADPDCASQ